MKRFLALCVGVVLLAGCGGGAPPTQSLHGNWAQDREATAEINPILAAMPGNFSYMFRADGTGKQAIGGDPVDMTWQIVSEEGGTLQIEVRQDDDGSTSNVEITILSESQLLLNFPDGLGECQLKRTPGFTVARAETPEDVDPAGTGGGTGSSEPTGGTPEPSEPVEVDNRYLGKTRGSSYDKPTDPERAKLVEALRDKNTVYVDLEAEGEPVTYVSGSKISPELWESYRTLPGIEYIDFGSGDLTDEKLQVFADHKNIKKANLYGTQLTDASMDVIAKWQDLRILHLNRTETTTACLEKIATLKNLRELGIEHLEITDDHLAVISQLSNLDTLRMNTRGLTDAGMEHLGKLTKLRTLDLSRAKITDDGLAQLKDLSDLRQLKLENTDVTGTGLEGFVSGEKLERLDLSETLATGAGLDRFPNLTHLSITEGDTLDLSALTKLTKLQDLFLHNCKVTDEQISHAASLSELRKVTLQMCPISSTGLQHLSKLENLQVLNLGHSDVGDEGLAHLTSLPALKEIDVSTTYVSDAGLSHLGTIPTLESVEADETHVTKAGVEAFKKALPDCYLSVGETLPDVGVPAAIIAFGDEDLENLQFSPDARLIGVGGEDFARIWDIAQAKWVQEVKPSESVNDVAFMPNGRHFLTLGPKIEAWTIADGARVLEQETYFSSSSGLSPDRSKIADESIDEIHIISLRTKQVEKKLVGYEEDLEYTVFSADGKQLATAHEDYQVLLWDLTGGQKKHTLAGLDATVYAMSFTADGKQLVALTSKRLIVWNLENGEAVHQEDFEDSTWNVALSVEGTMMAREVDEGVRVRKVIPATGDTGVLFAAHCGSCSKCRLSADGHWLATYGEDMRYHQNVKIWQVPDPAGGN